MQAHAIPSAQPPDVIALPPPRTHGGMPLMDVLRARRSSRTFDPQPLPAQTLSDLLWAAFGVNRADGGRTAPSARDWQEIDVYAFTDTGVFRYAAREHQLVRISPFDLRARTGVQDFAAIAPLDLVYVADLDRIEAGDDSERRCYSGADAGCIAQNVYLYCASEGLATVVRGLVERAALARAVGLSPRQRVLLAQSVGLPAAAG